VNQPVGQGARRDIAAASTSSRLPTCTSSGPCRAKTRAFASA